MRKTVMIEEKRLTIEELRQLVPALKEAGTNRLLSDFTKEDEDR